MISINMIIINNNNYKCDYNHSYHNYDWYVLTNRTVTIILMINDNLCIMIIIVLTIIIIGKPIIIIVSTIIIIVVSYHIDNQIII